MGRLVVTEFMSLDGVMEAPGGEPGHPHSGWVAPFMSEGQAPRFKLEETLAAEALLIGRTTYESFAGAWPERDDEAGFAAKMNSMPKYVVSSTLADPEWDNTTVITGDLADSVTDLKASIRGMILVAGSHTLVHALIRARLVDEIRLMIAPVVLGSGLKVFPEGPDRYDFELTGSETMDSGVVVLTLVAV